MHLVCESLGNILSPSLPPPMTVCAPSAHARREKQKKGGVLISSDL
jgi:hypothetical protein